MKIAFSSHIVLIKRGYQQFQEPHGSSIIKVKGVARVSIGSSHSYVGTFNSAINRYKEKTLFVLFWYFSDKSKRLLWDAAEYGMPPIVGDLF